MVKDLMDDAFSKGGNKVEFHDYYKYRISYITSNDYNLMFLFVTGLTDNFDNIKKELTKCKKEFLNLFEDIIQHKYDSKTFEVFDPTIDSIHRNLRPKISLVGFSGVGKTTITRLIKAEEIPMQHIPTITGDIATIKIGKLHFHLWDFAGQEQFSYLWNNFIKGSDAVLLITDSSLENVEKSKFFLELIKEQAPNAHTAIIGNKQDLEESMKPEQIEKILGLKTYSMIAKDPDNRDRMIQIVADILEMSAEVSPLLKPLLERDTYIEEATKALENAEFEKSAQLFEKISDLCIELGDDSLGREFYEKAQKIHSMLEKASISPGPPKEEVIEEEFKAKEVAEERDMEEEVPKPPVIIEPPITELKPVKIPGPPPSLPKTAVKAKVEEPSTKEQKQEDIKSATPEPLETPVSLVKESTFKRIDTAIDESNETKKEEVQEIEPEPTEKVGLKLNPEDFMVKPRPKTITKVPKDAKQKLKTSPYGHVSNTEKAKTPVPINPIDMIKPKTFIPPKAQGMSRDKTSQERSQSPRTTMPKTPFGSNPPLKPSTSTPTPIAPKKVPTSLPPTTPPISTPPLPPTTPSPMPLTPPPAPPKLQPSPPQRVEKPLETSTPIDPMKSTPATIFEPAPSPEASKEPQPQVPPPQEEKIGVDSQQKAELEKSLMDLKVKKANISKMALDLDMKELTGEITPGELEEKKSKLEKIGASINQQIQDIENMLK